MAKLKDITGLRFGRLVAQSYTKTNRGYQWTCLCDCGKVHQVNNAGQLKNGTIQSCGCLKSELLQQRTGKQHPTWRGGRSLSKDGYVIVYVGPNEYRAEHIVVMEQQLGRRLLPQETVHHKNGVRDDNRLDNLELWSSSHPAGQRVSDKIRWAREILETYS